MAAELTRDEAIALVERIMSVERRTAKQLGHRTPGRADRNPNYADEGELGGWLDQLERDLVCPGGYVSNLIYWSDPELTAAEVVDRALAYQPIQMRSTPWT
ncbi:e9imm peptide [Micromonospora aurantiaca (nom. illeg.)]|uniref:e9imm peptide n=1 Tax=Micromonospora aurantiaca (nom. illeg.) TaxID=47850 RepID=UPI00160F95BE